MTSTFHRFVVQEERPEEMTVSEWAAAMAATPHDPNGKKQQKEFERQIEKAICNDDLPAKMTGERPKMTQLSSILGVIRGAPRQTDILRRPVMTLEEEVREKRRKEEEAKRAKQPPRMEPIYTIRREDMVVAAPMFPEAGEAFRKMVKTDHGTDIHQLTNGEVDGEGLQQAGLKEHFGEDCFATIIGPALHNPSQAILGLRKEHYRGKKKVFLYPAKGLQAVIEKENPGLSLDDESTWHRFRPAGGKRRTTLEAVTGSNKHLQRR